MYICVCACVCVCVRIYIYMCIYKLRLDGRSTKVVTSRAPKLKKNNKQHDNRHPKP